MEDENYLIARLMERLNESERKQSSTRNNVIQNRLSHFNMHHKSRKRELALSEQDRVQKRAFEKAEFLIKREEPKNLGKDVSPHLNLQKYIDPKTLAFKQLQRKRESRWLVSNKESPDGKPNSRANKKRAFYDADIDDLKELQPTFFRQSTTTEAAPHAWKYFEDPVDAAFEHITQLRSSTHDAVYEVEYESSAMSGKSPGRRRRHHSTDVNVPDNRMNDSEPLLTPEEEVLEIPDSQDAEENEGVAESSRRVKPNTKEKLKQHRSVADAGASLKDELYAHNHDNACDSGPSNKNKDAGKQRKPWWGYLDNTEGSLVINGVFYRSAAARYHSKEDSRPDYSPPQVKRSFVSLATAKMHPNLGGVKPINRLRGSSAITTSSSAQSRNIRPTPHGFDLHNGNDSGRPGFEPPQKKQKTGLNSEARRAQTHKEAIDVEAYISQKTPSARSAYSCTQVEQPSSNGSKSGNAVETYRAVENIIQPHKHRRPQNEGSSNGQSFETGGAHQTRKQAGQSRISMRGKTLSIEDPEDPISEDEVQIVSSGVSRETTLQIFIPSYQGTAKHNPPRSNLNGKPGLNPRAASSRSTKSTTSPYFLSSNQRRSSKSNSEEAPAFSQTTRTSGKRQIGGHAQSNAALSGPGDLHESDASEDELAMVELPTSSNHPARRQQMDCLSAKSKINSQLTVHSDTSDDHGRNADIQTLPKSKKNPKRSKSEDRFHVIQLFCASHAWLSGKSDKRWSLRQSSTAGIFNILDDDDIPIQDFDLLPDKITRIERSDEDGKIILYKPRDNTAKGAVKIFLRLGNVEQNEQFCENMKLLLPTIGMATIVERDLKKRFENILSKIRPPLAKPKRPQEFAQLDDFQMVTENARKRVSEQFEKFQAAKQPNRNQKMRDQMEQAEENAQLCNTVRARRTRSSSDVDPQESPKRRRIGPMPPAEFYFSKDDPGDHLEIRTSSRRSNKEQLSQPPPKQRTPSPERWTEVHPDWVSRWRNSVIYPKEGRNKATVDKEDIPRLDNGQFLNDNLILFYMLWLERDLAKREPSLSKRIYFHNSYFYERLSKPAKGKKGINYEGVERWTTKVDLFSYDYVIVPVNEHTHWYVAIICNAPKLLNPELNVIEDPQSPELHHHERREDRSDSHTSVKSDPTSPHKRRTNSPSDAGLAGSMKQVSLTSEPIDLEAEELPIDGLGHKELARSLASTKAAANTRSTPFVPEESLNPALESIDVDEITKPAATIRKGKRKSNTPRKYNPKEPRIITLDSLGMAHSPTCTNLRDYLIAEMKSKHGKEMSIPSALGMKAINIPQQKNYCDCGPFLLSYVEEFLRHPDEFSEALLQKVDVEVSYDFTQADKMRERIRELLFDLQDAQNAEEAEKTAAKLKAKKAGKPQDKDTTPTHKTIRTRETSRSVRAPTSREGLISNKSSAQPEVLPREAFKLSVNGSPQPGNVEQEPNREYSADSQRQESHAVEDSSQREQDSLRNLEPASQKPTDLVSEAQAAREEPSFGIFKPFYRIENAAVEIKEARNGRSLSDAVQIIDDDSPQKTAGYNHQTSNENLSKRSQEETELARENGHLSSPSPGPIETLPTPRGRQSTPYPVMESEGTSSNLDGGYSGSLRRTPKRKNNETAHSTPLQPAPKPYVDDLDDVEAGFGRSKEDDDEMLLGHEPIHPPPLLEAPPSSPIASPEKQQSAMSPRRGISDKSSPRKNLRPKASPGDPRASSLRVTRDPSDNAVIGSKGSKWTGKRTTFSP